MKKISRSSWFWVLAAILCMAPSMVAAVQMQLTGAGGDIAWTSLGGIYINPYTATIDGVSTTVLCDDFGDDTYVNQTWKADVYTADQAIATGTTRLNKEYGGLTGFDTATLTMKYTQVADLAIQLLSASNVSDRAAYSFALWGVFDSTAIGTLQDATIKGKAQTFLQNSATAYTTRSAAENSQIASAITIYSPIKGTASCCSDPPQELIAVKTAEAFTPLLFGVDFAGLGLLVFFVRRRQQRQSA